MTGAADGERHGSAGGGLAVAVLSCFGLGKLPFAPGTWGAAGAMVVAALLLEFVEGVGAHWLEVCVAWTVGATLLTVLLAPGVERTGGKDPQVIVMDEVAGFWSTMALVDGPELAHLAAGFFVCRFFDILKPWPAGALEKLPGGWGIALDDVMAGVYGALVLWGAAHVATLA